MFKGFTQAVVVTGLLVLAGIAAAAERTHSIMLKAGSYKLDTTNQTILSNTATFEEDADSELAVEYEYRLNDKVGLGVEFVTLTGNYSALSTPGEADGLLLMVNARRYYDMGEHVKPFFGAGIGASAVDMSGPIIGNAGGFALQGLVGIEFPFNSFGLVAEYKYVSAKPEDDAGEKVDISGSGLFAGVVVRF